MRNIRKIITEIQRELLELQKQVERTKSQEKTIDEKSILKLKNIIDITRLYIDKKVQQEDSLLVKDYAISSSINAIAFADLAGNLSYVNPSFLNMWGYNNEAEVLGKNASLFWESEKKASEIIELLHEQGKWFGELKAKGNNGSIFPVQLSASRVVDTTGKPICLMASFVDITKLKQAEKQLQESESRLKSIISSMDDLVFTLDKNDNFVDFFQSPKKTDLYVSPEVFLTKSFKEVIPLDVANQFEDVINLVKTTKVVQQLDYSLEIGGKVLWFNAKVSLRKNNLGKFDGTTVVVRNITDRKLMEEELKKSHEQLRNLSAHLQSAREEERSSIAREIHDELGQVLTALKMQLSLMPTKIEKASKMEIRLKLLKEIESMSKLIDNTVQTLRKIIEELKPEVLDESGLMEAIEWYLKEYQSRTGIKGEITSNFRKFELNKDRSRAVFRIFQESLTNIARHAGASHVMISLNKKSGNFLLTVVDDGKGIPRSKIFDSKSIGLIGMRERALFLGGNIQILGRPGNGTKIILKIPIRN